jgi:hypothetical protein
MQGLDVLLMGSLIPLFCRWEGVDKTAAEWITKMEGLVLMWEKQAATAEKVGLMVRLLPMSRPRDRAYAVN